MKVKGWKLLIRFSFVSVHVSPVVSSEQWRKMLQAPQLLVSFFFLFLSFFCPDDVARTSWLKDLGRSTVQGCESLCTWFWWMLECWTSSLGYIEQKLHFQIFATKIDQEQNSALFLAHFFGPPPETNGAHNQLGRRTSIDPRSSARRRSLLPKPRSCWTC